MISSVTNPETGDDPAVENCFKKPGFSSPEMTNQSAYNKMHS